MKTLIIASLLFASVAHAETITLAPTAGYGHLEEFLNVGNDAGANIDIYPGVVIIDGVFYKGDGEVRQSDDGRTIDYTAVLASARVCVRTGRGQSCYTRWTLVSGSITR